MALRNGGEHDPELRTARLEMAAEWLRRFRSEDGLITGNFRSRWPTPISGLGLYVNADTLADADEYVAGRIDSDELVARARARYGLA